MLNGHIDTVGYDYMTIEPLKPVMLKADKAAMVRPRNVTASDSALSRPPRHEGHVSSVISARSDSPR